MATWREKTSVFDWAYVFTEIAISKEVDREALIDHTSSIHEYSLVTRSRSILKYTPLELPRATRSRGTSTRKYTRR